MSNEKGRLSPRHVWYIVVQTGTDHDEYLLCS